MIFSLKGREKRRVLSSHIFLRFRKTRLKYHSTETLQRYSNKWKTADKVFISLRGGHDEHGNVYLGPKN